MIEFITAIPAAIFGAIYNTFIATLFTDPLYRDVMLMFVLPLMALILYGIITGQYQQPPKERDK